MQVEPTIFKAYDIRGVYPGQLDEEIAEKVGRAYAKLMQGENPGKKLKIAVASDMRTSSPALKARLIKGLTESGVDVVDVGLTSTPTFYFGVAFYGYDGGVQVSASHNPPEFNGFKMVRARGVPISGETGIQKIRDMVIEDKFENAEEAGKVEEKEGVTRECVKVELAEWETEMDKIKPFKVVIDAANAMGAVDTEAVFELLQCRVVKMNFELDGTFPVHQPDPLKEENLAILRKRVMEERADLGVAPDGDGDRYFIVDEKGQTIRQEILRGILAQQVLAKFPGAKIGYDIRPGKITPDLILEAGGVPFVTRVGHSLIKEQMLKEDSPFSGESSGHYFYKFSFGSFEAPAVLLTKFLIWVSQQNKPLSEAIAPYQRYFHSGEINSKVAEAAGKIEEIKKTYVDGKQNLLDGVTVEYADFWFNVRSSNTESALRLNLEARSKELMEQKRDEVLGLIRS